MREGKIIVTSIHLEDGEGIVVDFNGEALTFTVIFKKNIIQNDKL